MNLTWTRNLPFSFILDLMNTYTNEQKSKSEMLSNFFIYIFKKDHQAVW